MPESSANPTVLTSDPMVAPDAQGTPSSPEVMPTVVCADGVVRPSWADRGEAARVWFDEEWNEPVHDEKGLFELMVLLVLAGGLTWGTVIARRGALRAAFVGYDVDAVADFSEEDVERLLADPGLIRNRAKIEACVQNAVAVHSLRRSGGLSHVVWAHAPGASRERRESPGEAGGRLAEQPAAGPVDLRCVPRADARSAALAAALAQAGCVRLGPVAAQALLLSAGVVRVERPEHGAGAEDRRPVDR